MSRIEERVQVLTDQNHRTDEAVKKRLTKDEADIRKNIRDIELLTEKTEILWEERSQNPGWDYYLTGNSSFSEALAKLREMRERGGLQGALSVVVGRWEWKSLETISLGDLHIHFSDSAILFCNDPGVSFFNVTADNVTVSGGRFIYRKFAGQNGKNIVISSTAKNTVIRGCRLVNPAYPYPFKNCEEYGCSSQYTEEE